MKLTENFSLSEFNSKDGASMPDDVLKNIKELAKNLQWLRDLLGVSISVNSGYRSPSHNKAIGGAHIIVNGRRVETSQHVKGNAADIVVQGYSPKEVKAIIEREIKKGYMKEGGLSAYKTFTHYDIGFDGKKRRW